MEHEEVNNEVLENEEYVLEYHVFNNCTFNNCTFTISDIRQTGKPKEDDPPPGTGNEEQPSATGG